MAVGDFFIVSRSLQKMKRENLEQELMHVSFTCGAPLQDFELPERLVNVYVRDISCEQPIERPYYTAKYHQYLCSVHAHSLDAANSKSDYFPQCVGFKDKPKIKM